MADQSDRRSEILSEIERLFKLHRDSVQDATFIGGQANQLEAYEYRRRGMAWFRTQLAALRDLEAKDDTRETGRARDQDHGNKNSCVIPAMQGPWESMGTWFTDEMSTASCKVAELAFRADGAQAERGSS